MIPPPPPRRVTLVDERRVASSPGLHVDPELLARAHARAAADVDRAIEELEQLAAEYEDAREKDGTVDVRRRYIDRPFMLERVRVMRANREATR